MNARTLLMFTAALAATPALAEERPRPPEKTYSLFCAGCHDAGNQAPGTNLLRLKREPGQAVLKGRQDLPAAYVREVVRKGYIEMAPFRYSEITDQELDALIEWIRNQEPGTPPG